MAASPRTEAPVVTLPSAETPVAASPSAPVGAVRLASSLRVAPKETPRPEPAPLPAAEAENTPFGNDELQTLWAEVIDHLRQSNPEAFKLLNGREVRLAEGDDLFTIVADSSLLDQELRPYKVSILKWMRTRSHRPQLNCQVIVEHVEREKLIYAPRDKYEAMLAKNPTLETFHVLFPEIDY